VSPRSRFTTDVPALGLLALSVLALAGCTPAGEAEAIGGTTNREEVGVSFPSSSFSYAGPVLQLPRRSAEAAHAHETEEDWAIARATVAWGSRQGLQRLPVGEVAAILGSTFVGAPYEPGTLELPGPERLVVNLSTFDCVTFVEHMLVL